MVLTIHDQTASGNTIHSLPLEFPSERITIRDLIRERVYQEVQDYNRRGDGEYRGLVQPTDSNAVPRINQAALPSNRHRPVNWQEQFAKAIEGFTTNRFFLLIDDLQADELDREVLITRETQVTFVKLAPMVGG